MQTCALHYKACKVMEPDLKRSLCI